MPPGKRELARIERRLIATLTDACETAKGEIKGFTWLTHTADLNALAATLKVIWVFETEADKNLALTQAKARIFELTATALREADIDLPPQTATCASTPRRRANARTAATGVSAWPGIPSHCVAADTAPPACRGTRTVSGSSPHKHWFVASPAAERNADPPPPPTRRGTRQSSAPRPPS